MSGKHSKRHDEDYDAWLAWTDALDPSTAVADDPADLRAIADISDELHGLETRLRDAVAAARENGRTWTQIAVGLGISRQAATKKYRGATDPEGIDADSGKKGSATAKAGKRTSKTAKRTVRPAGTREKPTHLNLAAAGRAGKPLKDVERGTRRHGSDPYEIAARKNEHGK